MRVQSPISAVPNRHGREAAGLARLGRRLRYAGIALGAAYVAALVACEAQAWESPRFIPPRLDLLAAAGLVLIVLAQVVAAAAARGWRRLLPLAALALALPVVLTLLVLIDMFLVRRELGRVTLPDGRVLMLALQPGPSDSVYELWQAQGLRWRPVVAGSEITYSEDGRFTADPALVLTEDGSRVAIRRGGIWTDCWTVGARLEPCVPTYWPDDPEAWYARSEQIARAIGRGPGDAAQPGHSR